MGDEGLKLKLLLGDQRELVELIETAETKKIQVALVCRSVGFHDDPEVHREVVAYLASLGCETHLVPDGRPDRGLVGIRKRS